VIAIVLGLTLQLKQCLPIKKRCFSITTKHLPRRIIVPKVYIDMLLIKLDVSALFSSRSGTSPSASLSQQSPTQKFFQIHPVFTVTFGNS
jgi:hypothetical protein